MLFGADGMGWVDGCVDMYVGTLLLVDMGLIGPSDHALIWGALDEWRQTGRKRGSGGFVGCRDLLER